jgi:hypothetical protein
MRPKRTLHLILKKEWFDMILSGEKKEEYRNITPHWESRFIDSHLQTQLDTEPGMQVAWKEFDTVTFSNGYTKARRQMIVNLKDITFGYGNPEWGATPKKQYFVLTLGKIIKKIRIGT